jgi:hypothetical protein
MFTLSFGYSASKNYRQAIEMASDLGGTMTKGIMEIRIQDYELLYSYESLYPLLGIIQNWKSINGSYNGTKVNPVKFLSDIWNNISRCAQKHNDTWNKRHCWLNVDHEGWGCKLLNSFSSYNYGDGRYKRSDRFWYNYGEYVGKDTWKINKNLIFEKLHKEIDSKSISLCPFFNINRVKKTVDNLPNSIKINAENFIPYYNESNQKVNIRHRPKLEFENNIMESIPMIGVN